MIIKVENSHPEGIHKALNLNLKTKYRKSGYEYDSNLSFKNGNISLKSFHFNEGFDFNILSGNISTFFQLDFTENENNYLRYFFIKKGELIHTITPNMRYRLTDNYSCMVTARGENNQLFTFPVQNDVSILFLQIEAKRFSIDLKSDFFSLPPLIGKSLMNYKSGSHFIYHSNYTLSIADTINEILNTQKEGITKRFFLESKALELLWLQTELYNHELKMGYNPKLIRQHDVTIIAKAKDYIHHNIHKDITISTLSREVGTNETKLKTGFKKLYGKTFSDILRTERLNKAKVLVEEGQMSIKEIANSCGYRSISMFISRFKERYGETPGRYMKT